MGSAVASSGTAAGSGRGTGPPDSDSRSTAVRGAALMPPCTGPASASRSAWLRRLSTTTRTGTGRPAMSSIAAAREDNPRRRPACGGPRSITRTVIEVPVSRRVTRTTLGSCSVACAARGMASSHNSPSTAVCLPGSCTARPVSSPLNRSCGYTQSRPCRYGAPIQYTARAAGACSRGEQPVNASAALSSRQNIPPPHPLAGPRRGHRSRTDCNGGAR